jgi:DNA uptake protein ComE-like DNA-binding protein
MTDGPKSESVVPEHVLPKSLVERMPEEKILRESPHDARPAGHVLELNSAPCERIAQVDFIGERLARTIVDERERRGGFRSWNEVLGIPGMNATRVAELQRAARLSPRSD